MSEAGASGEEVEDEDDTRGPFRPLNDLAPQTQQPARPGTPDGGDQQ